MPHVGSHPLQLKHDGGVSTFRPPKSTVHLRSSFWLMKLFQLQQSIKLNKWALKMFRRWQLEGETKVAIVDAGGLFKDYELHKKSYKL